MSERRTSRAILGSFLFLLVVPGTVAGLVPFALTGWRVQSPLLPDHPALRISGAALALAGFASLLESFTRFAVRGRGTPAPVAPPTRLVISGQYRHVRNPMYLAILALVVGQGMVFGNVSLLAYAAVLWILFHAWVVWYEEPKLVRQFGSSYQTYQKNVRRWWPRVRPWHAG